MWEKLLKAIGNIVFLSEQSRRNAEDVRELRKRIEEIVRDVDRLNFELQRTREGEEHKREQFLLRIENKLLHSQNRPRRKDSK